MTNFNTDKITAGIPAKAELGFNSITAKVVLATAQATDDTITFCKIPKGAIVQAVLLSFSTQLPFATNITIQLGDGTTAARFGTTGSLTAAGNGTLVVSVDETATASEVNLVGTISASSGSAQASTIRAVVLYTMNTL